MEMNEALLSSRKLIRGLRNIGASTFIKNSFENLKFLICDFNEVKAAVAIESLVSIRFHIQTEFL